MTIRRLLHGHSAIMTPLTIAGSDGAVAVDRWGGVALARRVRAAHLLRGRHADARRARRLPRVPHLDKSGDNSRIIAE